MTCDWCDCHDADMPAWLAALCDCECHLFDYPGSPVVTYP